CSICADDIYNKDDLETIDGNEYLICDPGDPIQSKVFHLYCRGQYAQSGQCVRVNHLPICKCYSDSGMIVFMKREIMKNIFENKSLHGKNARRQKY
ncbi:hypothetical protein BpHYR1_021583, partial [Brachionus plicatilis]